MTSLGQEAAPQYTTVGSLLGAWPEAGSTVTGYLYIPNSSETYIRRGVWGLERSPQLQPPHLPATAALASVSLLLPTTPMTIVQ